MSEKVITMEDFDKRSKMEQWKSWVLGKLRSAGNWVYWNKESICLYGPMAVGMFTACIKAISKHAALRKEENLKDLYCYDRSLGHYWKLRRELTNSEWVEIDKRKKNGERLADILSELKVLK